MALPILIWFVTVPEIPAAPGATLVDVRKIWDDAPHNAFTDLARFQDGWFCVFREGKGHVSPDGAVRVIHSANGTNWHAAALLRHPKADLRDPKLTLTADGRLMLIGAAAWHAPSPATHQTLAWFSSDGTNWSNPELIGESNLWLWRVTWHQGAAYGVGYDTTREHFVRLYRSTNGRAFDTVVPKLFAEGYPNETSLVFQPDETLLCLLRRDGTPANGLLGRSRPPYREWTWLDLGAKLGGPHLLRLPDGRLIAAVRLYDRKVRTALTWIDAANGRMTECLALPSGGDSSYAGLVWHQDVLWVSYYSSHEGKTSIYLAKVRLE